MKTIADFADLPDLDKLILVDFEPGMQLNEQTWTQHGVNTNAWYMTITKEIFKVEEDGSEYDEEFSISDCDGNSESFYYDDLNQILYVNTHGSVL